MIDMTRGDAEKMTSTNRLICEEMLARGWKVKVPYIPTPHMFVDRGDGVTLHLFSATPPTVSYSDAHLVDNKFGTYHKLLEAGVTQLETCMVSSDLTGLDEAMRLMAKHQLVVVKPIDGGHGRGITVGVENEESLRRAIELAFEHNRSMKMCIVQQQLRKSPLRDVRIACIGKNSVAAIERIPARVHGDGQHSIAELVMLENEKPERGLPYRSKLAVIDPVAVQRYLGERIHEIPLVNEEVRVLGVANYGMGGELEDVTDQVPAWMTAEAESAARSMNLDVIGVDYIFSGPLNPELTRDESDAVIIEVNKCPALSIHDEPTRGKPRNATKAYVDFIASLSL